MQDAGRKAPGKRRQKYWPIMRPSGVPCRPPESGQQVCIRALAVHQSPAKEEAQSTGASHPGQEVRLPDT